MKKMIRVANLAAIAGTSWMVLLVLLVMFRTGLIRVVSSTSIGMTLVSLTELVFAVPLLFFFVCLYRYERAAEIPMVPCRATALAVVGSTWMVIIAVLHRLPGVWRWIAMQQGGLLVGLTQILFAVPLLVFFIVFGTQRGRVRQTSVLRAAAITASVAVMWSLIVSASHLWLPFQSWLTRVGVSRLFIITEPFMAFSFLFFLVMFYIEQPAMLR